MIVSHKYKLIFIKNRRVAGSTIEALLAPHLGDDDLMTGSLRDGTVRRNCRPQWSGHMPWQKIEEITGPEIFKEYEIFCIERSSFDKVISDWSWHFNILGSTDLDIVKWSKSRNLSDWKKYTNNDVPVGRIFQYRNLRSAIDWLSQCTGIDSLDLNSTYLKRSERRGTVDTLVTYPKLINIVETKFKKEIEYFNY